MRSNNFYQSSSPTNAHQESESSSGLHLRVKIIMKVCLVSILALASSTPQAVGARHRHIRRLDKSTSSDKSRSSKDDGCDPTDRAYLLEKALKLEQISKTLVHEFGEFDLPSDNDQYPIWRIVVDSTGAQALKATMPGLVLTDLDNNGSYDKNEVTVALNAYLGNECVDNYYDEIVTARISTGSLCENECSNELFFCLSGGALDDAAETDQCIDEHIQCTIQCISDGWIF